MSPLLLIAAGLVALGAAFVILRSLGSRFRVGRLLAATPLVTVAEARRLAESGVTAYVRVAGRIDAAEPFEDADHRPLVFRRTRLEARGSRAWTAFEDSRETVPFEVREGLDEIGVDGDALGDGLVVVRRESEGAAGDLGDRAPADLDPSTSVRAVIEQVSAVDHAMVLGVPRLAADGGRIVMTSGKGRPLILTTLETSEAMRILAGGSARPRAAAALLAVGGGLLVAGLAWAGVLALLSATAVIANILVPVAYGATPTPGQGGDPRSSGEGPGLVGEPVLALLIVVGIALISIVATTLWIRLTDDRRGTKSKAVGGDRGR